MTSPSLPIDAVLSPLRRALASGGAAVLQAPPGAGKTTRVPLALLDEPWLAGRGILMLEPRRLAATNAARYMASLRGEAVGESVGYVIRFDRKVSRATRIEVVTEGILTRRLQSDPELSGVGLVIFDEFHERGLHSDLALALCRDAQQGLREDLKILVMSATLDAAPVAELLGGCTLVTSAGRSHPVEVRYAPRDPQGHPAEWTAAAVRRALRETQGDLLVFLPGAGEIRRCRDLLGDLGSGVRVAPLFGDLPFAEQERAILPGNLRRVVLATNIAETSLTIEGVRVVVDSGLERRPRFDPARGTTTLETMRISGASADQRTGRAGRLGPGTCYRLWSEGTQGSLLPFSPPEIRQSDLAPLALELARWGVRDPESLSWLEPPPPGALAGARQLLRLLGALDEGDLPTVLGGEMALLPAHPRLARLLVEGRRRNALALACDLAALLGERDLFRREWRPRLAGDSDLLERLEALERWRRDGRAVEGADPGACRAVERAARFWRRKTACRGRAGGGTAREVGRLLGVAFPDRIALAREGRDGRYLLCGGQGGRLSPRSGVVGRSLVVAVDLQGGPGGEALIHMASAIEMDDLEALAGDGLAWRRRVAWDDRQGQVAAREERVLGALVLNSRPVGAEPEEVREALIEAIRRGGLDMLNWSPEARQYLERIRFAGRAFPEEGWPELGEADLLSSLEQWLGPFLDRVRKRADLRRLDLLPPLRSLLDWNRQRQLDGLAPERLAVPSGSKIRLDYASEGPPVLAVKLQELFGLAETPRVARGRVAVLLHLLSPARRPIQVTQDLGNFWNSVYPEVKKELKGRYPKHPWPDDPWRAEPTRFARRRK